MRSETNKIETKNAFKCDGNSVLSEFIASTAKSGTEKKNRLQRPVFRSDYDGARPVRRILLTTDFSPESRITNAYAASIARHFGAQILMVHVGRTRAPEHSGVSDASYRKAIRDALREECQNEVFSGLQIAIRLLNQRDFMNVFHLVEREIACDFVITTTPVHSGWKRLGTVDHSSNLIANSSVPVFLFGPAARTNSVRNSKRIFVTFDFSEEAIGTLSTMRFLANHFDCIFKLVCIQKPAGQKSWHEKLFASSAIRPEILERRFSKLLNDELAEMDVEFEIVDGDLSTEAINRANEMDADLVLIGTHGTLDKESRAIVRQVHCPVVTTKSEPTCKFHHW